MTQEQLGEALHVSNKTVSRWETGTYIPPADALLAMSALFQVSVNELLSGKRLSQAEYRQAAEENLTQAVSTSRFTLPVGNDLCVVPNKAETDRFPLLGRGSSSPPRNDT